MSAALIVLVAILVVLLIILFAAVKVAREYERGIIFRLGRLLPQPKGPGLFILIPVDRPDGEGRPPHGDTQRAAAGGDHEGQRARPGQRGRVLPDRGTEGGDRPDRELHGRYFADLADDAPLRTGPAPPSTSCSPNATRSTRSSRPSSTRRPRRGGSRSRSSRSRTSRSRATCSGRWRARPRPSASGARR